MGLYLKPRKSFHNKGIYFKSLGASSTFYPARINANLAEISDGSFKEKHAISITDKDTKVTEIFARELSVLHSHLLWLTDLLVVNNKMADLDNRSTIEPIIAQVLDHQRWVQALLSVSLALLTTNTRLVSRDVAISTQGCQVLKETFQNLRTSPLLGDLMFHLSLEDILSMQKRCTDCYVFQVLKQAVHAQHPLPHETSKSQGLTKP